MRRDDWEAFELRKLPLSEANVKHSRTCTPCGRMWTLSAYCVHESVHASVALDLGLKVEFVAVDSEQEIELTREEAALYPLVRAGMKVPALCTRLDERSLRREPEKVLVAMAAPSCVKTGHRIVDEYGAVEACIATERARVLGFDPEALLDRSKQTVERVEGHVLELAERLAKTGWVDLLGGAS